jgi:hypothetical protein
MRWGAKDANENSKDGAESGIEGGNGGGSGVDGVFSGEAPRIGGELIY